jgi:hypothetical protein
MKIKKISNLRLKRVIKEEIINVLSEQVGHAHAAAAADMVGKARRGLGFSAKPNPNAEPKKFIQNFFKAWSQAWHEGKRGQDYYETMDVMKDAWKDLKQGNERKALNDTWVQLINVGLGDIATLGVGKALWDATKKAGMHENPEIQEWIRSHSISPIVHDYDEARQMGRELAGTVMSVAKKVGDLASGFASAAAAGAERPGGAMAMKAGIPFMQENKDVNSMKITKQKLRQIIKEELEKVLLSERITECETKAAKAAHDAIYDLAEKKLNKPWDALRDQLATEDSLKKSKIIREKLWKIWLIWYKTAMNIYKKSGCVNYFDRNLEAASKKLKSIIFSGETAPEVIDGALNDAIRGGTNL